MSRTPSKILLASFALLSAFGCDAATEASDPGSWEFPSWGSKEDALGEGLSRTTDLGVRVFEGFNAVTDASVGEACVRADGDTTGFTPFRAGATTSEESLEYIESLDQLHESLQLDATAQVKAGPLGVDASTSITREFKSSETALSILLRTKSTYLVINQNRLDLTDEASALATSDPAAFVRKCGTHFVGGVEYGAELRLLITIQTNSIEEREAIRAGLEAEGIQAGPTTIGAGLSTSLSEVLEQKGVTVTAHAETQGFQSSVSLTAIEQNPLDPSAMALAKEAVADMKASIAHDLCHDQGESAPGGTCNGTKALGYLANGGRSARPTGVELRAYRAAADFPDDPASIDAFLAQRRLAENALAFIEDHARLYAKVLRVHSEEVGGLLDSPNPFDYAIYNPNDEFDWVTEQDLRKYAEMVLAGFDPENGSAVEIIADSLRDCWNRAESGDFGDCQGEPERLQAVRALFDSYETQRIRPIYYHLVEDTLEWQDAEEACPAGFRLPNKYEATRLYTAVTANPAVPEPRFADVLDEEWALWVADEFGGCDQGSGLFLEFGTDGGNTFCYENPALASDMELPVLCVPNAGPYGADVFDL